MVKAVSSTVQELKASYTRFMQQRVSPEYKVVNNPKRGITEEFWFSLAGMVEKAGLTADEWVAIQFERFKPYPYINILKNPIPANDIEYYRTYFVEKIQRYIEVQASAVNFELRVGRSLEEVLNDPQVNLNPLFRYALAVGGNLTSTAERFKQQAHQLLMQPAYRSAYSKFLPDLEF